MDTDEKRTKIQLNQSPFMEHKNSFVLDNNSGKGKINYAMARLNPAPQVSGEGVLLEMKFKALKPQGKMSIKVKKIRFGTSKGDTVIPKIQTPVLFLHLDKTFAVSVKVASGGRFNYWVVSLCAVVLITLVLLVFRKSRKA